MVREIRFGQYRMSDALRIQMDAVCVDNGVTLSGLVTAYFESFSEPSAWHDVLILRAQRIDAKRRRR